MSQEDIQPQIELEQGPNGFPSITWEQDGFTIEFRMEIDQDPDLSHLGEFTNQRKWGAIRHEESKRNNNVLPWFVPGTKKPQHVKVLIQDGKTKEEAEELAAQFVMQDYKRLCQYGDDWVMLGAIVSVSMFNVELATSSLWGIESDSEESFFVQIAKDLASDAISQAKTKLQEIVANVPDYTQSNHSNCN